VGNSPLKTLLTVASALILIFATSAMSASGQSKSKSKTDQIQVEYQLPKNPAHQELYKLFKERTVLERVKKFLSPFRLPMPIMLVIKGCDGDASAAYGDGEIEFCYEFVADLLDKRPEETTPGGVEPMDAVIGPFLDTALHEFAHALFDLHFIPILGREEDAADQVAAYIYLQLTDDEVRRLVSGTVYNYLVVETMDEDSAQTAKEFLEDSTETHSLPAQRGYNLLCVAYGSKPKLFSDVVSKKYLPSERAEVCTEEYEQLQQAFEDLIEPHIDLDLADDILDKPLLLEAAD